MRGRGTPQRHFWGPAPTSDQLATRGAVESPTALNAGLPWLETQAAELIQSNPPLE